MLMGFFILRSSVEVEPSEPLYPHLGTYRIGGDRRYDLDAYIDAAALRNGPNIIANWPGWESGKTRNLKQVADEIHSRSTVGATLYAYLIYESTAKSNDTPGEPLYPIPEYCEANNLWAYANGPAATGQVDSYNSAFYQINHTLSAAYEWIIDWYKSWLVDGATIHDGVSNRTTTANPSLDGLFLDNFFPEFDTSPAADMNMDGSADTYSGGTSRALCQSSNAAAADYVRTILPGKYVLGNSARYSTVADITALEGKLNGGAIEGGIGQSYSYETNTSFQAYIDDINTQLDAYAEPKWGVVVNIVASLTNYALIRYQFAACLMTRAYFDVATSGLRSQDLASCWYDEFDWLEGFHRVGNPPTGPADFGGTDGSGGQGYWIADFENGVGTRRRVICAARRAVFGSTTNYSALALGGTYKKMTGTQDPTWNDGSTITSITMAPRTGIVLELQ